MTLADHDLMQVDLGKLGSAVSDWKKAVDHLKQLETDACDGLQKSERARWEGLNAGVTQQFVSRTAKDIADLHMEANGIHKVLDDAHRESEALQKGMRTLTVTAKEKGYTVRDNSDGTVRRRQCGHLKRPSTATSCTKAGSTRIPGTASSERFAPRPA
ncbi:hypothetical protein ACWC10_21265 [Streptomyces sp. NPDC001595]|uniref:hypothetical protein n=1 Tax=Streptomyces sp. NPDC001532 TaxID=3154520 RepID=UPI0033199DBA